MAYGFTFYKPATQGFDSSVLATRAGNPSLAAQIDIDRIADNAGTLATRLQVLEAFQGTSTAPILPSETLIRQWMISGLGYKRQSFIATQNSLFNSDSAYATQVAADRLFQEEMLSPLTLSQTDNQNGFPSQSTQDTFGNNKTVFLLAIDNGNITGDLRYFLPTSTVNALVRDDKLYKGALFDGSSDIFTQSNPALLNNAGTASFSFEAWIYRYVSGREDSIISRLGGSAGFTQLGFDLYINTSNQLVWAQPPFATLTSSTTVPVNSWQHIAISYDAGGTGFTAGRRMFINGVQVGSILNTISNLRLERLTRTITSFSGSGFSHLGYYNALFVTDAKGFSLYDSVSIAGYKPATQSGLAGGPFTIGGINYDTNLIELVGASIANLNSSVAADGSQPILVRNTPPARSASTRGVIARSVDYPNRIFMDRIGLPSGGTGTSGVQDSLSVGTQLTYRVGEKVVFHGVNRGGATISFDQIYYITSVVATTPAAPIAFGGYITVSLQNVGQSLNGVDATFSYFTDNGQAMQMFMSKVADNVSGGSNMPFLNTSILSTNSSTRNSSTTKFLGLFGSARFVLNATPYRTDSFTPPASLGTYTQGGSTNLLINSNNGIVPVNTGQGSLNLGYTNQNNITIFSAPKYLGSVLYNGFSSYTAVAPGTNPSIFQIPPSTNWCAEAWINPIKAQASGIIGSGTTAANFWTIQMQPDRSIVFNWDNSSFTGSVTASSTTMTNVSSFTGLSAGQALEGQGLVAGTTISSLDPGANTLTLSIAANATVSGASYSFPGAIVGTLSSGSTLVSLKTWSHVAASLNGNTLRLFLNGTIVASTTIVPRYFKANSSDSKYYVGLHAGAYFYGYIATPRLVVGKSIYTSNFTVSTTKPRAARVAVLNAYAQNNKALVIPDETGIQYWMWYGFDNYTTIQFTSTDITWNQVDSFYHSGNTSVTKTYPFCVGKEFLVNQTLLGTPDVRQAYYSHTITTNSGNGSVSVSGGNVDAYITVLMR